MQDLEYLIQILKFCEKKLTKGVPGGVVGATSLEGIDCYALKCTKITLFAKICVSIYRKRQVWRDQSLANFHQTLFANIANIIIDY